MIFSPNDAMLLIWVHFLNPDKKVLNVAGCAVTCVKYNNETNMNMFHIRI